MLRNRLFASAAMAGLVLAATLVGSASAIDSGVLLSLYGEGMKAFYAGRYAEAHETFTQAIEAGSQDPRCYYFRGLANNRLGRGPDAQIDFKKGAELEARDFDVFYNVSGALERIQGNERLMLERHRAAGRKFALAERERIRFEHYRRFAPQEAVAGPATTGGVEGAAPAAGAAPAMTPAAMPAANPFGAPSDNPFGAPAAPTPAAPAAPASGTPAPAAPTAPAAPAPATTNPFGN
jgi:tetratricopeptide (TPR) repeat protein